MVESWFIFIESNTTGTGEIFAEVACKRGFRPVVLASSSTRYPFLERRCIDSVQTNTSDFHAVRQATAELAKQAPIAGVYSSSEYFIEIAAELANSLGLPGGDYVSIRECRNKLSQRLKMQAAGSPIPRFCCARSMEDVRRSAENIGLPCIIKPTLGTGSSGVRLCVTMGEMEEHAERLLQCHVNERGLPIEAEVLIEEYVRGQEYSVETFHGRVIGITRKHTTPEPYFVETGHDFPAVLSPDKINEFSQKITNTLQAMGLMWGPAHTELRCRDGKIAIIEINPRLAGGFIPELVRLATGVSLIETTLAAAVGEYIELESRSSKYASIRFLVPEEEGVLVEIEGINQAIELDCIRDVRVYYQPGHVCRTQRDFRDRVGHVIAVGDTQQKAIDAAENALQLLRIKLDNVLPN